MKLLFCLLSYAMIVLITIIVSYYLFHTKRRCTTIDPVNVPVSFLHNTIPKGVYKGQGYYTPTSLYPNGITTKNRLTIQHTQSGIVFHNEINAFDHKTKAFLYKGFRDGVFTHKLNHDKHLFRNSKHYIITNNNTPSTLATSLIGYAIRTNHDNEIVFDLSGVWYISNDKYKHITQYIMKEPTSGDLFINFTSHNSKDPSKDMIIKEHYVKQ